MKHVACNGMEVIGERYYVTFGLRHEPFVCRLSVICRLQSATLLRPTQRVEALGNILAMSNNLRSCAVCIKILEKKKFKGFWMIMQGKWKGV